MDKSYIINTSKYKHKLFSQYFFSIFSKPITKYYLNNPDIFVIKLLTEYPLNDQTFYVILEVLKISNNKKKDDQAKLLIEKIVKSNQFCEQLKNMFSWNEIYEFVELSSNVIDTFRNESMIFFQLWICEQLTDNNLSIYHKCRLLGFLPKLVSNQIYKESLDCTIRKCLIDLRDKHFSGPSSKLKPRSIDLTNLVTTFQKILTAMELSSSYLLFEVVVEWCIKDPNHAIIELVKNCLHYFFQRLCDETQFQCCDFVYKNFRNEFISESRREMIVNIFLIPIMSFCRKNVITTFYTDIIDFILKTVNENLLANDSGKARHLLISKIACFKLIEEMFKFFTNIELNNGCTIPYTYNGSHSKDLITQFRTSSVKVRYSNVNYSKGSNEIKQLFRQLHCCSYNTLITIISNTEDDVNKYTLFLFNERPPKQFIWRNLVDCSICYEFPIDFDMIPQRKKKIINIRTKSNQNIPEVYIDLSSHLKNTLIEDLGSYDYNNSYLKSNFIDDCSIPNSQSLYQMLSVELEMDSFNNHECMAHLCAVIKYLTSENIIGSTMKPNVDMPNWMNNLKLVFSDNSTETINSKILLIKLIINCETNFEPYAKHWLSPLMQFVLDQHLGNNLNYFITDVVSMLISWHNTAVPTTKDERLLAKKLFSFLLSVAHSEVKNIFKHNMELIKCIVENWKCSLDMDYDELLSLLKPNQINNKSLECGLHLIGILSANGITPFNEFNKKNFLRLLTESLQHKNQVIYLLSSEIFGMLLKIYYENSINEMELLQCLSSVLKFSENMDITRVLSCLYYIHKYYSKIIDSYLDDLFHIFEKLQGIHRTQCLEMILNRLTLINDSYEKITVLKDFFNMLKDNGTNDQLICLKIILQLIPTVNPENMMILIKIIAEISQQHNNYHRKLIYEIMYITYEIYLGNNDDVSKQIMEECKMVLLNGLMDNDDELRHQVFRFWADDKRLPLKCVDRLLILLDQLYSPNTESHFLGNFVSILLESCCTALDYDQKIFQYPLHACEFEDYNLTASWRAKHTSNFPKFADTIVSQLNHSNTLGKFESNIKEKFQIKNTMTLQFQPTIIQTQLNDNISILESYSQMSSDELNISTLDINQQSWNQNLDNTLNSESHFIQKKKNRIMRNKSTLSKNFAMKNIQTNVKREIFKKERAQKRESSVNTYRKYRIGDFPDIEITNASIITPLIELSKRDNNIARIISSSIMYGLKNNPKINQQYFESLNKSLITMLNHSHGNHSLTGFILDTAYCYPTQINLDPNKVTEVATSCGLMSLGALVIETSINYLQLLKVDEHIEKKSKITYKCLDDNWIKLAEIYKNIGELDVVEGIFQEKINNLSCDSLKEALKAEQTQDWRIAQKKFKSVLECNDENIILESDKDFLFEEYYKCSENLSDWKEINKMLKSQTGESYEKIWNNNWYKNHLLHRILHSELNEILTGISNDKFIKTFSNWLNNRSKEEYILTHVPTQACMIFLCCDDLNKAQLWCKLGMRNFLKEWEIISPQYYKLRADKLLNLQTLSEIYYFIKSSSNQSNDYTKIISRQIKIWESQLPIDSDSLLLWDTKILNRSIFLNKINADIDDLPSEEKCYLKQILNNYEIKSLLALIESAINKNNYYVAKKYLNEFRFENIENWTSDYILCRSKILAMSSCYTIDAEKKIKCYLNSWSELDNIIKEQCSPICLLKTNFHIANISKNIAHILHKTSDINLLSKNVLLEIMNKIKSKIHFKHLSEVLQQIDCTIIQNLKNCIHIALDSNLCTETIVDSHLMLAQYCLEELNFKENTQDNQKCMIFIESVLKAMKYGSKKASELFPIILQFENLTDYSLKEIFISENQNVPEYMFLQWINQILGCLDSPLIDLIGPLLIRLCEVYPKAVILPLKMFMERKIYNNKECETFLKAKLVPLISDIYLDIFVKAISNVCCPFTQLLEYINDVQESIKTNNLSLIILEFENIFKNCFITNENQEFKGKEFKTLDFFKDNLKLVFDKIQSSDFNLNDVCMTLITIKKQVDAHKNEYYSRKLSTNLINYCPWLALYSNHNIDTIEIPGQYCGTRKPNIDNHITITSFKPNVRIIFSMRNPIKITMNGNDGKKYSFLIKFGEDLRQDQRIQQLHKIINDTFSNNSYCCDRQLSLLTYIVFPISTKLGMIEWINNTVTLKDLICESFPGGKDSGIKQLHFKVVEHYRWLSEKSDSSNKCFVYAQATINYNSMVTVAKFKQLVQSIPADILRKSLLNLCHCAETFICLRSKFITSFSVLSICHWLLGIGDRHLDNTIVSTKTGFCIGIDFNFAFHTATSIQTIPELIPFRMSPHIVSLMAPLNLTGFIRETMVHTLKTLIDNQEMILSVMQVFINDPSADWIKMAKAETLRINEDFDSKEVQWFPKKKILSGKDKMNGINPIEILCRELEISCIPNDYKKALLNILKSDSLNNTYKRSKLQKCNITQNQQIDCLLDIATDHQILCLAYSGLQLWV
ncbi:unnamed protein product [Aphis gossypii]|uniref:Non-specific serine/threonine protein kinase n=1 Tax=Aphis gossypii TaxID=80765 RepID=A0A9P0JEP5_APHGO|nr:unnamed protein product [Aphis gossypii]